MSERRRAKQSQEAPDDHEPSLERQAELRAAYEANRAAGRAPYAGVEIRTRGEVRWIIRERAWVAEDIRFERERVNLSGADLVDANLRDISLRGADLFGTRLRRANLCGASLRSARMDVTTVFVDVALDTDTWLGDVIWNGTSLTRVDWSRAPRLGDEREIRDAKTRPRRIQALRYAARAYHGLAVTLREQGLTLPAAGYRLRGQRLERRALRLERKPLAWLFSALLDLVAGYGERPARTVVAYLLVIFGFAGLYEALGQQFGPALPPIGALVFSITSFHGRGFFPGSLPSLTDPLVMLAALEAVIGLFIELVFIATFSRRFLGN